MCSMLVELGLKALLKDDFSSRTVLMRMKSFLYGHGRLSGLSLCNVGALPKRQLYMVSLVWLE